MRKLARRISKEEAVQRVTDSACGASTRLKAFTAGVIEGKTMQQAALDAGFAPSTAASAGRVLLPRAKLTFAAILEHYAPLGKQAKKIAEGMEATHVSRASYEGRFLDEREDPDWETRRKYLELAAKMQGTLADEKASTAPPVSIQVQFVRMGAGTLPTVPMVPVVPPVLQVPEVPQLPAPVQPAQLHVAASPAAPAWPPARCC